MMKRNIKRDIAIIGMSGRFPKSKDLKTFWNNLVAGEELISFPDDDELRALGLEEEKIQDPNYVTASSRVDNPENFDHAFFGYTKAEAALMDPQIRMFHEQVWLALEDAGYNPYQYLKKIGLYVSAKDNFNWRVHDWINQDALVNSFYKDKISKITSIGTLVSYNLNLRGPSYFIETACSSSLTATHTACRALLTKDCTIAIAGAITLDSNVVYGYEYEDDLVHSHDGRCRAFDKDSTGTVGGEGVGIIVMKRLEDALNDGDHIYALIRSSAVNNDGKRKVGFTAPSVSGQSECIQLAHKIAGITYKDVSYIETHGTGTKLGDPVEVEGLNKAFHNDASIRCAIGSVKSNMGHLDGAAGVAGLIKTVLALKHKKIPASLHFKEANPEIDFKGGPFYVNASLSDWKTENNKPRIAGVSSYGIGGTNAHIVLEEAPKSQAIAPSRNYQMMLFSAKSEKALARYKNSFSDFLSKETGNLNDLAFTLKTGREAFRYRSFVVGKSKEEILANLEKLTSSIRSEKRNVVFMFPGSGSQYIGMAKDLYFAEPDFKETIDRGFAFLKTKMGIDFTEVLYGANSQNININDNRYTQPIIVTIEYAFALLLMKWGIEPNQMIGHSTGEYVAACISGVFSFEECLELIIKRAELISQTSAGGMLTVGLPEQEVRNLLNENLSLAAVNSPDYCVVSGNQSAVDELFVALEAKEIPCSKLRVSVAGHSFLMDSILEEYKKKVEEITLSAPKKPFISNLTGKNITAEEATSSAYWCKHLRETVHFYNGVSAVIEQSRNNLFIEVGPGRTLTTFLNQIVSDHQQQAVVNLVRHPKEEINDQQFLTSKLAEMWTYGLEIDWNAYYGSEKRNRVAAPGYSFEKTPFMARLDILAELHQRYAFFNDSLSKWFYLPEWKRSLINYNTVSELVPQHYVVFYQKNPLLDQLIQRLTEQGNTISLIKAGNSFKASETHYEINPQEEIHYQQAFDALVKQDLPVNNLIYTWHFTGEKQEEIAQDVLRFMFCCKAFGRVDGIRDKKFTFIGQLNQLVTMNDKVSIANHTALALLTVLDQEYPDIFSSSIDVDVINSNTKLVSKLVDELVYNQHTKYIAYRAAQRFELHFNNLDITPTKEKSPLRTKGVYLITGGYGKIASVLSNYLVEQYQAKVILIGRSDLPTEQQLESLHGKLEDIPAKTVAIVLQRRSDPLL